MLEKDFSLRDLSKISNILTVLRIALTPFIFFGIVHQSWYLVFSLLLFACLTDILDGYFARKYSQGTRFGACLDPLADKILLVSSFAALAFVDSPSFSIPTWFFFVILFREITMIFGFLGLTFLGIDIKMAPSVAGKLTTFFQLSFIMWIFLCYFFGWNPTKTYTVSLILLTLFSIASFVQYGMKGVRYLRER